MRTFRRSSQRTSSRSVPVVPSAPGAPTGLTATADGLDTIDLDWTAPTATGGFDLVGYKIERKVALGEWETLVANTGSLTTAYEDTGLIAATLYTYRVSAISEEATSGPSDEAGDTTAAL